MKDRIRELRTSLGLSTREFAKKIGVTASTVSLMENGKRGIGEQTLRLIINEFGINSKWLRTGEGEMYDVELDERTMYVASLLEHQEDPFNNLIIDIMKVYFDLSEEDKKVFQEFLRRFQESRKESSTLEE